MIQGGDITHGNGVGGESIYGRNFPDEECIQEHIFDTPFLLAMANRGPNSNNSQVEYVVSMLSIHCFFFVLLPLTLLHLCWISCYLIFDPTVLHYNSEDSMARF